MNQPLNPAGPGRGGHRPRSSFAVAALVVLACGAGAYALGGGNGEVAVGPITSRAEAVMGFDLDATKHTFVKTAEGGVEDVVVDDPGDRENLDAIRSHLRDVAGRFAAGDFSDPARIHGADMPGLAALQSAGDALGVRYDELTRGARITYSSSDANVISALHAWFDAQNSDHSRPGMGMGH